MRVTVVVFLVCVVAASLAHVAILVSIVSSRATKHASAAVPRPNAVSEFAWALVPILALALLFTATWERVRDREHPPEAMKVAR